MLNKLIWLRILLWYQEYLEYDFFSEQKNIGIIKALASKNPFIREGGQELFSFKVAPVLQKVIDDIVDVKTTLYSSK
jgi:hypothetical protein